MDRNDIVQSLQHMLKSIASEITDLQYLANVLVDDEHAEIESIGTNSTTNHDGFSMADIKRNKDRERVVLKEIELKVSQCEDIFTKLRADVDEELNFIEEANKLSTAFDELHQKSMNIESKIQEISPSLSTNFIDIDDDNNNNKNEAENKNDNIQSIGRNQTKNNMKESKSISRLSLPNAEQFDKIPRYMRGKLTLSDLHVVADIIDKCPLTTFCDVDIQKRSQLSSSSSRIDITLIRSAIQCLRHIGSLKTSTRGEANYFEISQRKE